MKTVFLKQVRRKRRKQRVRKGVFGTAQKPRLTVYRSLLHVYAQLIDDLEGKTVAAASSVELHLTKGGNATAAKEVGKKLAEKAKAAGIREAAFDRNGFKFHGVIKALAGAAREGGLKV